MLTADQRTRFARDGYLVIPGILSGEQVSWLRSFLEARFQLPPAERYPGDTDHALFDLLNRYPELRFLLFNDATLSALRHLLGPDFTVMREIAAHRNVFTGWHKDTTSQEKEGHTFQWNPDFLMVEAGYYLQDNTREFGGGLDVEPGSHCTPDPFLAPPAPLLSRIGKRLGIAPGGRKAVSVPTRAGDLLVFDFRINHRATPSRRPVAALERPKLAVFVGCSRRGPHVEAYQEFLAGRPAYAYLRDYRYHPEMVTLAGAAGVHLG